MRAEEEIYYPALAEIEEFAEKMDENITEHDTVKQNLNQMRELSVTDETFQSRRDEGSMNSGTRSSR